MQSPLSREAGCILLHAGERIDGCNAPLAVEKMDGCTAPVAAERVDGYISSSVNSFVSSFMEGFFFVVVVIMTIFDP